MKTRSLLHQLHTVLNMLKGFTAGYKSSNAAEMLIEKDGIVYKLMIQEVGSGTVDEYINDSL